MRYGELPIELGQFNVNCSEMMFYQYLPIKLKGEIQPVFEDRLLCFNELIGASCCDFIAKSGLDEYKENYIYLTAKNMYQLPKCSYNRGGWHSDGFMTDDINYVWCDKHPTIFSDGSFQLSQHDELSLMQMDNQSKSNKTKIYQENTLLRLNQFNIHKVNDTEFSGMRAFLKISFSKDKYNLIGNSHNYLLDYSWEMKLRQEKRNIPQNL